MRPNYVSQTYPQHANKLVFIWFSKEINYLNMNSDLLTATDPCNGKEQRFIHKAIRLDVVRYGTIQQPGVPFTDMLWF